MRGTFRIGISQFWIGQKRLQRAVTRELSAPDHFYFRTAEWQEQNVFKIVIVVRFAHRGEIDHFRQPFLHLIGVAMQSGERCITRIHQVIVLVRRKIDIERHQAFVQ